MSENKSIDYFALVVAYLPFLIISLGLLGNTSAFLVFRFNINLKKMSSMMILSFVVVVDTFSLFIWNVDHFYYYHFGIYYEFINVPLCRIMLFIQYTSLQSSGWLLSLLCIDRFITVMSTPGSIYKKLPFSTKKSAIIWSTSIILVLCILNSHILMFNGFYDPPYLVNKTMSNITIQTWFQSDYSNCGLYTTGFKFYPIWDIAQIYIYSFVPSLIMITFNTLLIAKTLSSNSQLKRSPNDLQALKSFNKKRKITISLIAITLAFVIMTLPSTVLWGFFGDQYALEVFHDIGGFLDFISFLNHTSIFWTSYFTNTKFKRTVDNFYVMIFCKERVDKKNNKSQASIISTNGRI